MNAPNFNELNLLLDLPNRYNLSITPSKGLLTGGCVKQTADASISVSSQSSEALPSFALKNRVSERKEKNSEIYVTILKKIKNAMKTISEGEKEEKLPRLQFPSQAYISNKNSIETDIAKEISSKPLKRK